ncbi:5039_t:CDS:2 [Dentiscutata heterogama]|uniref:5039_t:CDS:1 n=1 Tax=Dentiscutata heterogama TaxID=1316150 RepID=A0ACA9L0J6_9GLOM|nr:5039_t:CDS:2 [Dentiscutata heterogama]
MFGFVISICEKKLNKATSFYESDPIDYDENNEIDLINSTDLDEERFGNITDKINEELFENAIRKKSRFINWDELSNVSKLDEGYFGFIFKAYWKNASRNVVCKALINLKDINSKYYAAFIHELTMQTRADLCENIVRFLGVSKDTINDRYFLIMEYATDGNLRMFLKRNNHSLDWHQRLELACQINKGLHYMHSEDIIHRDLHDKNIVIHDGKAKITDFGNAISINTQTNILDGLFGMISFVAPELFNQAKSDKISYSKKTDIYSLSMLFWELSSGRPPFENQLNRIELAIKVVQGDREDTKYGTHEYRNLYIKCWDADPDKRPDTEKVYKLLEEIVSSKNLPEIDPSTINLEAEQTKSTVVDDSKLQELSLSTIE